jgi:hypothetical protein
MRILVLIAAVVLASASAQAGESRSLSAYPDSNDTTAMAGSQPVASKSLRADNDTTATQPTETPRYSPPPADTTSNQPSPPAAETPHYAARPAPVDNTPRATPAANATQTPSNDYSPRGDYSSRGSHGRHMRAERPHPHRWTAGRIIATLHHYGIYW